MLDLNLNQLSSLVPENSHLITFTIKVNDAEIPSNFEVTSIRVVKSVYKIPYAIITLIDGDVSTQEFAASDTNIFTPGNKIEIEAGYHSDEDPIFSGIIIKHGLKCTSTSDFTLQLECKDVFVKTTVGRKNRYFFGKKDSIVIEEILDEPAYDLDYTLEETAVDHKRLVQYYATDWDFINIRAEANGQLVIVDHGQLTTQTPDFEQEPKAVLNFGSSIYEFQAEMDARDQFPKVKATTWDSGEQEIVEVEADENGANTLASGALGAVASAVTGGVEGIVDAVTDLLGLGEDPNTDFKEVIGLEHWQLQHTGELDETELQNWAAAKYTKSRLAKLRGSVKFEGFADLAPGDSLKLVGAGKRHEDPVIITGMVHDISNGAWFINAQFGLKQEWFAETFQDVKDVPAAGLLPGMNGLQIGIVTDLEDADNKNRVRVKFPLMNTSEEGIWARLAAMDAGDERGAFFLPEKNDEVIVGFLNDDPREAVILGKLHSSKHPAPLTASNDNHEKGWVTRSKMKVIFNDDKKSLTIETPAGKKIILDEDAGSIQLLDEHNNKIEMTDQGIVIESGKDLILKAKNDINIDGTNIANKAKAKFSADGKASELTATSEVVIDGKAVRIN